MTPSLTLVEEGLGWLIPLPIVLINESCTAHAQGVRETKYPAHRERERDWANDCRGGTLERDCYLGNFTALLLLLELFGPNGSKNITFGAVQSSITMVGLCKQFKALIKHPIIIINYSVLIKNCNSIERCLIQLQIHVLQLRLVLLQLDFFLIHLKYFQKDIDTMHSNGLNIGG